MIKAVFFDIDGTLYDSDLNYINQESLKAINTLHKKGYILGLCTGRSRKEILSVPLELLNLPFDIYITSGGSCSYLKDGTELHHTYFTQEQAQKVVRLSEIATFDLDIGFLDNQGAGILWPCGVQGKINYDWYKIPIPDVRQPDYSTISHFMLAFEEKYHALANPYLEGLSYFTSSSYSVDVYPPLVDKAYGIQKALKSFGISLNEVMAFGDSDNDKEMLEQVKLGIAMGKASEACKNNADFITTTMQENGIIEALKKFEVGL